MRRRNQPLTDLSRIAALIHTVRGQRVILDADLARVYGVETRMLNQAVKRNRKKFPSDFMFRLTEMEVEQIEQSNRPSPGSSKEDRSMRSQSVIASERNIRHRPFAFTEHGAIMGANVLKSSRAAQMSVFVVRAFIRMRALLADTQQLAHKLAALERELKGRLDRHETAIVDVLQRIMSLIDPPPPPPEPPKRGIGFHARLS